MYISIPAGSHFLATAFRRVFSGRLSIAAIHLAFIACLGGAHAQVGSTRVDVLPVLVVTPFRSPLAADRTATAITVINRQQC